MRASIEAAHSELWDASKGKLRRVKKGERGFADEVVAVMRARWPSLVWLLPSDIQNAKAQFWKGTLGSHGIPQLLGSLVLLSCCCNCACYLSGL